MIKNISNFVSEITNLKTILIFLVLFIIAMVLVNSTFSTGVQNLTQTFNYTPEKAYEMMHEYGDVGRLNHLRVLYADIFLVVLYTVLFSTSIMYISAKLLPSYPSIQKISLLPFVLAAIQLLEIIGVFILLKNFPNELFHIARITNIITVTKIILTYICILITIIGFVALQGKNIIAFARR